MIHPCTFHAGPLQAHELVELAELLDDLDAWAAQIGELPEDLGIRIPWWALRLANLEDAP
jgi:hypothetical protein